MKNFRFLLSACLAGINCRYDGKSSGQKELAELLNTGRALAVCPEILGGLPVPRTPCEIQKTGNTARVIGTDGYDYTDAYRRGAQYCLMLCKRYRIDTAILKSLSPSCGCGWIYDGTFSRRQCMGKGITAELLVSHKVKVYTEENWKENFPEELPAPADL